jgi:hypothetical protein
MALTDEDKKWIDDRLEQLETRLLTAFHNWASPFEMRQRSHSLAIRALDVESEYHEDRLKKLEGRKPTE